MESKPLTFIEKEIYRDSINLLDAFTAVLKKTQTPLERYTYFVTQVVPTLERYWQIYGLRCEESFKKLVEVLHAL